MIFLVPSRIKEKLPQGNSTKSQAIYAQLNKCAGRVTSEIIFTRENTVTAYDQLHRTKDQLRHDKSIAKMSAQSLGRKQFIAVVVRLRPRVPIGIGRFQEIDRDEALRTFNHVMFNVRRKLLGRNAARNHKLMTAYATFETGPYGNHPHVNATIEVPSGKTIEEVKNLFMIFWNRSNWSRPNTFIAKGESPLDWNDYVTKYGSDVLTF